MMIHFTFRGGLGNQMFEYAYYRYLRHRGVNVGIDASLYNAYNMHNGYELPCVFGLPLPEVNKKGWHLFLLRLLFRFRPSFLIESDDYNVDNLSMRSYSKPILDGYFQSERYFSSIADVIRNDFTFQSIDKDNMKIASEMQSINSVSIHIRRGDYLAVDDYQGICTEEYYRKAISIIMDKVESPKFYVFSNDIPWTIEFFNSINTDIDFEIVSLNKGEYSYRDMYLMSQCRHNIVANSSFSWWGAWLNANSSKRVIAPKMWFKVPEYKYKNIVPQSWIKI